MAVARIGKWYSILSCLTVPYITALQLRVVSEQGKPLSEVAAGYPCLVELIIPATQASQQKPIIAGIAPDDIIREQESSQISVVNGVTTRQRTISYLVSFSQQGVHTIGPARLATPSGELLSNNVTLNVVDPAAVRSEKKIAYAQIEVGKDVAYLHEAVPYTIHFYYTDDAVNQVSMQPWRIPDAHQISFDSIKRGTTTQHGVACHYVAWSGVIYPQISGNITLPAVQFEYTEPVLSSHMQHQWAQFMQLFAPVSVSKQLRTQRQTIRVLPLPPTPEKISGVGTVTSLQLSCSADTMQQGESVICAVELAGDFDPESIQLAPLAVDDAVRVYASKVTTGGSYPRFTKRYEYILQGIQAGTAVLPAQEYLFFDPSVQKVVAHTTTEQHLYIMPNAQQQKKSEESTRAHPVQPETLVEVAIDKPDDMQPVPLIPLWIYLILLAVPVLWATLRGYIMQKVALIRRRRLHSQACRTLMVKLAHAVQLHEKTACLHVWNQFLQQMIPAHFYEQDASGATYLAALGADNDEVQQWLSIHEIFLAYAFSDLSKERVLSMFEQIEKAVQRFQSHIKKRGYL